MLKEGEGMERLRRYSPIAQSREVYFFECAIGVQPVPLLIPSPLYPSGHEQLKLPGRFSHVDVTLHGFAVWHSSISENGKSETFVTD